MKPLKLKLRVKWEKWVEEVIIIEERIVEKKKTMKEKEGTNWEKIVFFYLFIYIYYYLEIK
jgi:hypothetical protein